MIQISPSILAGDFLHLKDEITRMEKAGVDSIHFDIMDGIYVPNITFGFKFLSAIKKATRLPADVHLMIIEPERYIKNFIDAGADVLSFHYEAAQFPIRLLNEIKKKNCKAGISINPATPVHVLKDIIQDTDRVLIMSVEPGFYGQKFIEATYRRIIELSELINGGNSDARISVDGGVGLDNYKKLIDAGADIFVTGNSFFSRKDNKKFVDTIKKYARQ